MFTDEELFQNLHRGNHDAFVQLYERYEKKIYGFVLRRAQNHQLAEEIFHDVMIAIIRNPQCRFERGGFAAWIYKVAHHTLLNRLRSASRELQVESDQSFIPDFDKGLVEREQTKALASALSHLSEPQREIYNLRRGGKSYQEMATVLGIPVGTAKTRLHIAIAKLKGVLK